MNDYMAPDRYEIQAIANKLRQEADLLRGFADQVEQLSPDKLADLHKHWLDLFQLGQSISASAETLDSAYQSQF